MHKAHIEAHRYINAIRKPAKKAYAELYWHWLVNRTCNQEPEPQPSNLGAMAAQAVRMNLHAFSFEMRNTTPF